MTIGDRFSMYEYNTRSELIGANRYFGADTNDTSNPVGLQDPASPLQPYAALRRTSWSDNILLPLLQYSGGQVGNRLQAEKSGAYASYTANALNQLVLRSQEQQGEGEVGYTERMVPGSTDVIGSAETNVTVTVNNQGVNRQDNYWYKRLTVDNVLTSAYEQLNIVGVYSPGGTNEDIVSSVTGSVFVAETPEQFTYDPASPRWLRGTGSNLLTDGRFSYTWDGENRLISVETLPGLPIDVPVVHVAFDYDYMSRRVGKTVYEWDDASTNWLLAAETTFLYDSWNLVQEQTHKQTNEHTNKLLHLGA